MKRNSASLRNSGTYTNPGTPEYGDNNMKRIQKGWQSERVPLQANSGGRSISVAALMPFNSGRALPSKWEDAERWITSPVSGYGVCKNPAAVVQRQRRPKSMSGPLGSPGVSCLSNYSPAVIGLEGGGGGLNFMAGSPFTTGVLVADNLSIGYVGGINGQSNSVQAENRMARTSSVPGWADLLSEASSSSSQDEKLDLTKDVETSESRVISQRDMATQMSPTHSSPEGKSLFSTSPPFILPAVKPYRNHSAKVEVRDVQVDKGATVTSQYKRQGERMTTIRSPEVEDLASSWDIAEAAKNTSKLQREEAKIAAWENLQKAKAEAAIRKLEMKLEKKRSASMDKILNKLSGAQMKAQDMRSLMSKSHHAHHRLARTSLKLVSIRKYIKMGGFVTSCFFTRRAV